MGTKQGDVSLTGARVPVILPGLDDGVPVGTGIGLTRGDGFWEIPPGATPFGENAGLGGYGLSDFVDLRRLRRMAADLYEAGGIPVGIIGLDGTILVGAGWQDICVNYHRANPVTCQRCHESNNFISAHLHENRPFAYKCLNGMWDIALPLLVDGVHLATLFVGQFFYEDDVRDVGFFRRQAKEFGFDETAYLEALNRVPVFTRARVEHMMAYYQDLVQTLAENGLARLKLNDESARLHMIFESSPVALLALDPDLRICRANRASHDIFGTPGSGNPPCGLGAGLKCPQHAIPRAPGCLPARCEACPLRKLLQEVFETGECIRGRDIQLSVVDAGGKQESLWLRVGAERMGCGGKATVILAAADITASKKSEEGLRRLGEELEMRVQRRTAELHRRGQKLRALAGELTMAEERERRRISELIHDHLQQLLVGALLNLEMRAGKHREEPSAAGHAKIEGMIREALEVSRSLTAELSPSVLYQCGLAAALKWLGPWCLEKYGLKLKVEADAGIEVDEEIRSVLFRAVRELLFNVVKHAKVEEASVRLCRAGLDGLDLEVRDAGVGFDPAAGDVREGKSGGFGLFSIRERLVSMGGEMMVDSAPGEGTCVTLRAHTSAVKPDDVVVPPAVLAEVAGAPEVVAAPSGEVAGKWRILVADDHEVVRDGLIRVFQGEPDFEVIGEAVDGRQAVEAATRLLPDIVLMDLNMPHMDGFKATAAIHDGVPGVKVIGLSMFSDEAHRTAILLAGALDLLGKETPPAELVAAVREHALA